MCVTTFWAVLGRFCSSRDTCERQIQNTLPRTNRDRKIFKQISGTSESTVPTDISGTSESTAPTDNYHQFQAQPHFFFITFPPSLHTCYNS